MQTSGRNVTAFLVTMTAELFFTRPTMTALHFLGAKKGGGNKTTDKMMARVSRGFPSGSNIGCKREHTSQIISWTDENTFLVANSRPLMIHIAGQIRSDLFLIYVKLSSWNTFPTIPSSLKCEVLPCAGAAPASWAIHVQPLQSQCTNVHIVHLCWFYTNFLSNSHATTAIQLIYKITPNCVDHWKLAMSTFEF